MLVISDTNILSSFAAGNALPLLLRLFPDTTILLPPAAQKELQTGLVYGKNYLAEVLQAIAAGKLQIIALSNDEQQSAAKLPAKLGLGEREAIAGTQNRRGRLLSNDKQAIHYCKQHQINAMDLPVLLRLLWKRKILSQTEVRTLIDRMKAVENLQLNQRALALIFSPN